MKLLHSWMARVLIVIVIWSLVIGPQTTQAQSPAPTPPPGDQPNSTQQQNPGIVDPSRGPLQPAAPTQSPPAETQGTTSPPETPTPQGTQNSPNNEHPLGTAVGEEGKTAGGPASSPAGMAIAPSKQRQTRSLLIKIAVIAAAGIAVGTIIALTKATPSNPPGAK